MVLVVLVVLVLAPPSGSVMVVVVVVIVVVVVVVMVVVLTEVKPFHDLQVVDALVDLLCLLGSLDTLHRLLSSLMGSLGLK